MSEFGDRIRRLRRDRDITQGQLARFLNVTSAAIGKYEKVPNAYPSIPILIKIADYFQVSTDFLLRGITQNPTNENSINGELNNSTVIQANRGGMVLNDEQSISPEAEYLQRIYQNLGVRDRIKLLNFAVDLEEKSKFKTEE